ncbi:MAG: hypothetical protein ACU0DI_13640, partial [Paracoccaceae bacterium]
TTTNHDTAASDWDTDRCLLTSILFGTVVTKIDTDRLLLASDWPTASGRKRTLISPNFCRSERPLSGKADV